MMTASRSIKIGLFALAAIAAAITAGIALGVHALTRPRIDYHAYFDESVQGLELGSPVRYRGVRVGTVTDISIAPDRKHVDIELALDAAKARQLGLANGSPELRAQLGIQGITGVKYVEMDFFDVEKNPPPPLPFPVHERTIPTRKSLMLGLAGSMEGIAQQLPGLVERATATFDRLDRMLEDLHETRIATHMTTAVDEIARLTRDLRTLVGHVDRAALPDKVAATLAGVDDAVARARATLDRVGGDQGLVASAHRATDALGDVGRSTAGSTEELGTAIRELAGAARAIRELAEQIERDPDMLFKGRARSHSR